MTETLTAPQDIQQLRSYEISWLADVLTPALAIYEDFLDINIAATLKLLHNRPERWRPHIKTAKLRSTVARLVAHGITSLKCATTLELLVAIEAGATDILVAYPCIGSRARRVLQIQAANPAIPISALIDDAAQLPVWRDSQVGLFIDVDPGMKRTGIDQQRIEEIVSLAKRIKQQKNRFRGLHYYEGQHRNSDLEQRKLAAFGGYRQLLEIVEELCRNGLDVEEVITSGTPALPCALAFLDFKKGVFKHTVSPGTVLYNDITSLSQVPSAWGYRAAALVVTTVVSHPSSDTVTCDAGHKALACDAGVPNCSVLGRPELEPLHPSEEHLPLRIREGANRPQVGDVLYLIPRHVCPTINNFDDALLIRDARIRAVASVSARGREAPLLGS